MGCKTVFRGKRKSKTNHLNLNLRKLRKYEQIKPKASRRKDIIKIRTCISETENNRENQSNQRWVFEDTNKFNKRLAGLTRKKRR